MKSSKIISSKTVITPELIEGACLSGKGMTKQEAALISKWLKIKKASAVKVK